MVHGTDDMASVFENCLMHGTQAQELPPARNNTAFFVHRIMNQGKCCKRAVLGVDPNCAR
eukprot:364088-Chlamydomonas_euryale.AAC.6